MRIRLHPIRASKPVSRLVAVHNVTPKSYTAQEVHVRNHPVLNARSISAPLFEGEIKVEDNDFTGPCELRVGDGVYVFGIDFVKGADEAETASNIKDAIHKSSPHLTAEVLGDTVTVTYKNNHARVPFNVINVGTKGNITLSPANGWLANKYIDPVELTNV